MDISWRCSLLLGHPERLSCIRLPGRQRLSVVYITHSATPWSRVVRLPVSRFANHSIEHDLPFIAIAATRVCVASHLSLYIWQWHRNEFESGGGTGPTRSACRTNFLSCPSTFLAHEYNYSRCGERFRDCQSGQFIVCCSSTHGAPRAQPFVKVGTRAPCPMESAPCRPIQQYFETTELCSIFTHSRPIFY